MAETVQQLLCERAEDDRIGVRYGDRTWTWRAHLAEAGEQAAAVLALLDPARPPHVGAMLGNAPDMLRAMAAAALGGYVLVGLNTTRRGEQVPHIFPIFSGSHLVDRFSITGDDVCYVSMPLFHSNSGVGGVATPPPNPSPMCWPLPHVPTTRTTRSGSRSATRPAIGTSRSSPGASTAR